jgi:tetratricopeptide (TPR) repeat protein
MVKSRLTIAYLREDEWGLTSLFDFLIRVYESASGRTFSADLLPTAALPTKSNVEVEGVVWQLIRELIGDKALLVIVENLDTVLTGIGFDGQQRLRSLIQTYPVWNILATSTTITPDLNNQRAPFYGFFDLIRVGELSVASAVLLLKRLASSRGDGETEEFIDSPMGRARVRAIQHLAGGNSRIFVLFYDVLQRRAPGTPLNDYILEPLQKTIDALTPYYQAKMAAVSPLQQKILLYLCQRRVPSTVTAVANGTFSTNQTIASQLKQLLTNRYVRVNRLGRESFYELAEPLMRICLEAKSHDGEPLRLLVEFLRYWFYRDELEAQLTSYGGAGEMRDYLLAALKEYDSVDAHHHLNSEIERLCGALGHASIEDEPNIAEELATVSKIAEDWSHCVLALSRLGRVMEVVPYIEKAVLLHPDDERLQISMGRAYSAVKRFDEALIHFDRAIALNPKEAYVWYERGRVLNALHRYEDALASFESSLRFKPARPTDVRILKADVLMRLGRATETLATLRPVLKFGDSERGIFAIYGSALADLDRHREALEFFDKALKSYPADNFAMTHRGLSLIAIGDKNDGVQALRTAYLNKPDSRWTASHYCGALFTDGQYSAALEQLPNEVVAHRIFHLLLGTFNESLKQGALQNRLKSIETAVANVAWQQAFIGALTEFLSYASRQAGSEKDLHKMDIWIAALTELYDGRAEYTLLLNLFRVLRDFKNGAGLKTLLSVPLEQRRLLISEQQELALGKS